MAWFQPDLSTYSSVMPSKSHGRLYDIVAHCQTLGN